MGSATDILLRGKKRKAREWLVAGRAAEVRALLEPVCPRYPRDSEAWCLLGQAQGQTGAWVEAHGSLQHAADLAPADPAVWFFLGNTLLALGRFGEAAPVYRRALERNPRWPQALSNLGRALQLEGRDVEAIECFERALALEPGLAKTWGILGLSRRRCGRPLEAVSCFRRALELQPGTTEIQRLLGQTLADVGELEAAEACLQGVLRAQPDSAGVWCELGMVYRLQGRFEDALDAYRRVPDEAGARAGEAAVLEMLGRKDEARRIVGELLARGDRTPGTLEVHADLCSDDDARGAVAGLIREQLVAGDLPGDGRTRLLFRLGQLYDRRGEFAEAFAAWDEANGLVDIEFDGAAHRRFVDRIIETFSREAFTRLPRSGCTAPGPVFIVGMPRSGTSLVEQILASHSEVHGAGELPWIPRLADSLAAGPVSARPAFPGGVTAVGAAALDRMAREYLRLSRTGRNQARYVTDKLPVNFLYLGLIELLFPGARIVHCARDPRDTALSLYSRPFGLRLPFAYRLGDMAAFHGGYRRLMRHWEEVLPLPLHTVRYEALVRDPEPVIRGLLAFLELGWEPACLEPHRSGRVIATASYAQVRAPIHAGAVGRWRHYERYLGDLLAALGGPARGPD